MLDMQHEDRLLKAYSITLQIFEYARIFLYQIKINAGILLLRAKKSSIKASAFTGFIA